MRGAVDVCPVAVNKTIDNEADALETAEGGRTMTPLIRNGEWLDALTLAKGGHQETTDAYCVMEAVAYVSGEPWSDAPRCECPVITAFLINWNDSLPDNATRDRLLKPLIPLVVDTRQHSGSRTSAVSDGARLVHPRARSRLVRSHTEPSTTRGRAAIREPNCRQRNSRRCWETCQCREDCRGDCREGCRGDCPRGLPLLLPSYGSSFPEPPGRAARSSRRGRGTFIVRPPPHTCGAPGLGSSQLGARAFLDAHALEAASGALLLLRAGDGARRRAR